MRWKINKDRLRDNIGRAIKALGVTQQDLAKMMGVHDAEISNYLHETRGISLGTLTNYVRAFNKLYTGPRGRLLVDDFLNEQKLDIMEPRP